jgi:hypothetical protein
MFPRWGKRELFYWTGTALNMVEVQPGTELTHSTPRELFKTSFRVVLPSAPYDVAPDGQRFVFIREDALEPGPTQVNYVQGWFEELKRRAPGR